MTDSEIAALLDVIAQLRQQVATFSQATLEADMDAANEPDPEPQSRVMPARALRRQHAPGGLWPPVDA